jgi:hypothetical protein
MKANYLDPQLLEIFSAAANLYNREAIQVQSLPNKPVRLCIANPHP